MNINKVIEYWDKQPCNIKHSNKEIGTKEYFNEVSNRKYLVEPHILEFAQFNKWRNKKVLEVGCGIGTAAHSFIENGAIYKGLDLSEESIKIAKQRLEIFNLDGIVEEANIENYSTQEKFDLVYSFGVLHHTPDTQKAIKNIYNLLKPGGTFKLMLYAKNSWKYFCIKDGLDRYEAQSEVPIADVYTHDEVYNLLKDFDDIKISQKHIFPYKINEYKNYQYEKKDYFDSMPDNLFNCLENNLGWHLCITCKKEDILNKDFDKNSIEKYKTPYEHTIIKDMFNYKTMNNICNSIGDIDNDFWNNSKIFFNEHTKKKEITDYRRFPNSLKDIFDYLISKSFVKKIEKITGICDLIIDKNIYGGGISISPPNSKLDPHTDFNFNSDINLYRTVNLILYLNDNWTENDGGCFQLFDDNMIEKKSIVPSLNTMIIFASNNKTPHGFDEIKCDRNRKSLNLWYYTKDNPKYVDVKPHKTVWFKENKIITNQNNFSKYNTNLKNLFNNCNLSLVEKLNNFSLFVPNNVISKFLIRNEIFKKILNIHGAIVEIGVANGIGISTFQHLSMIHETYNEHRPLFGFDNFEGFTNFTNEDLTTNSDELFIGNYKCDSEKLILESSEIHNNFRPVRKDNKINLIKGDICETVPKFVDKNKHLIVALLYLDCDLYEPTKITLKYMIDRMPIGSIIVFDELANNSFPGETVAMNEILGIRNYKIQRFEHTKISYIQLS